MAALRHARTQRLCHVVVVVVAAAGQSYAGRAGRHGYLRAFEVGKIDFYKKVLGKLVGLDHESLILVSTTANFFHQTRLEDDLFVRTWCAGLGNSSVTLYQWLIDRTTGEVKADCRTVTVAFDFVEQHKIPLNAHWRERLSE